MARLGGDLELHVVLQRTVDAARTLVGARWAALGVLGQDGSLEALITSGMTEAERGRIDQPACGLGVLIARDPHDLVVQRLFAIGTSLRAIERQPLPGPVGQRLRTAVDDVVEVTVRDDRWSAPVR